MSQFLADAFHIMGLFVLTFVWWEISVDLGKKMKQKKNPHGRYFNNG